MKRPLSLQFCECPEKSRSVLVPHPSTVSSWKGGIQLRVGPAFPSGIEHAARVAVFSRRVLGQHFDVTHVDFEREELLDGGQFDDDRAMLAEFSDHALCARENALDDPYARSRRDLGVGPKFAARRQSAAN